MYYINKIDNHKILAWTKSVELADSLKYSIQKADDEVEFDWQNILWEKGFAKKEKPNEFVAQEKRNQRDGYFNQIQWRIDRYNDQTILGIKTSDTKEVYMQLLAYKQYLRDIPSAQNFPNIEILDFDKWALTNKKV